MRMFRRMRWSRACWAALGAAVSAVVAVGGTAAAATGWTVEWAAGFDGSGPDQALVLSYS
jgi:hypothetical protein